MITEINMGSKIKQTQQLDKPLTQFGKKTISYIMIKKRHSFSEKDNGYHISLLQTDTDYYGADKGITVGKTLINVAGPRTSLFWRS